MKIEYRRHGSSTEPDCGSSNIAGLNGLAGGTDCTGANGTSSGLSASYHGVGFLRSPAFWKRNAPTLALAQAEFPRVGMISLANQCSVSVGSM
jgi:hypothetical protein